MRKWADQVNTQRRLCRESVRISARTTATATDFIYTRDQVQLENPYRQIDEDDEDEMDGNTLASYGDYPLNRNESSTSLRSRSTTGESGPPMNRMPPRQFPMGSQAPSLLPLQTNRTSSPSDINNDSFFSPTTDSPISTARSSGTPIGNFPFPRQGMPPMSNGYGGEDYQRFTAPAMPRAQSRDGQANPYQMRGPAQRPSLPPTVHSQPNSSLQNRFRSASSPDIQNPAMRRYDPSSVPPLPDLPPFPTHYAYNPGVLNRSQSSSPAHPAALNMGALPIRAATQPPNVQQARMQPHPRSIPLQVGDMPALARAESQPRSSTPYGPDATLTRAATFSPQPPSTNGDVSIPTQLKVKVHCRAAGSTMVLVVSANISYQSLKDRIDAKLQRSTTISLGSGQVKLKYLDEDDYVSIQSDEDVQMAFETWREAQRGSNVAGLGEIELYIQ
jgi:cell division control protein 24